MSEDLEQTVALMKREIDSLQIAISSSAKPWYKSIPTLVSATALLFSFGTTYVSYQRTAAQDIQNTRQELRGLLLRLAALPKEDAESKKKYGDDPATMSLVGGFINQETSLLARQAAELVRRLPDHLVTGVEHYAIAIALQNSYDLAGAETFLKASARSATDFSTEIAALRLMGNLKFIQGQPEAGRVEYQRALNIFSRYPGYDAFVRASTNVWTELAWAYSEAGAGALDIARQHLTSARALIAPLAPSPGAEMLKAQLAQADQLFASNEPIVTPLPAGPLGVARLKPAP